MFLAWETGSREAYYNMDTFCGEDDEINKQIETDQIGFFCYVSKNYELKGVLFKAWVLCISFQILIFF